jgi:transglutaminase-like putative cysteine protease
MSIHVALYHKTRYTYDRPIGHAAHVVRLRPAPHCRTPILSYSQKVSGGPSFINWQQDPFANWNARLVFPDRMSELCVEVELVAEMAIHNPFDFFLEDNATHFPFTYEPALKRDLAPFLDACALTPKFGAYLHDIRQNILSSAPAPDKRPRTIDFLVAVNQRLQRDIRYLIRLEPGVQAPEETLANASGSCRDSGWLLVQLFRHCGLAARFVSGYLIQLAPDVKSLDGPSGTEKDFTDLHAWCEVYLPGAGWIGLDPTSGLLAGEGHIPLSCTPEPSSAAPVSGAVDPCESKLHHEMKVTRIYESPRVTKPYTEEQWQRLETLGRAIDVDLVKHDVRLTMGGEPTFVSIDDPDGSEWNFTAVSHRKRVLSGTLLKRLRGKFAPGSLLHYGQGKWYPGEPLPRWALAAYWRKDGVPIWKDDSLIADESRNYGHGPREAKELALRIARIIDVDPKHLLPGYEDVFYYTWKERRLPSNVTPEQSNLKDPQERERLAHLFERGLGEVAGYALPLKRVREGWLSGSWFLRESDILWLLPGDSPMGLRLPLDSIPWVAEQDVPWVWQQDPTQKLSPLSKEVADPQRHVAGAPAARSSSPTGLRGAGQKLGDVDPGDSRSHSSSLNATLPDDPTRRPGPQQSAPWIIRTALCVEPRDGRLHVFMPPVATTEDYLDLIAGIEAAVTEMGVPVIIEGETPPKDPRLNKLAVTPDPGVIEVNLHPSKSWDELVERTTVLYEEARQTRLGTEKFMADGRHTGTGGGNHIILGGESPTDSPILRRPDLLRSLLAYWQNHPSLNSPFGNSTTNGARRAFPLPRSSLPGWWTACFAICSLTPPATHTARNSASTNSTRRTVRVAGWAWSRCAPSKCRRTLA